MATRKMTFTIPEDLAMQLLRRVPARDRSRYVSDAISARLRAREKRIARACEIANKIAEVLAIEQEWDAMNAKVDGIDAPWDITPAQ